METISTELVVSKENGHFSNGDCGGVCVGIETIEISRTVGKKSFISLPIDNKSSNDDRASTFLQASDTSDMRLVVDGRPLYVSRVVLSLISPVFKEEFDTQSRQKSVVEISLPGKSFDDVLEFLCCVYPDFLKPISGL